MPIADYEESANEGSRVELYIFETQDGKLRWTYTTDESSITVMGYTFVPETISRSEIKQAADGTSSDRTTVSVPYNLPVAVLHVPYLPPRSVKVKMFTYQRRDGAQEIVQFFTGAINSFAQKSARMEFQCSQILDTMQQTVPWAVHKEGCIWATYEQGCDLSKIDFSLVLTAPTAVTNGLSSAALATKPDLWFRGGFIENTVTGEVRFITSHVGPVIFLDHPFTDFNPSHEFIAYAGDDKEPETCRLKFNNKIRYVGFDFLPDFNIFEKGSE